MYYIEDNDEAVLFSEDINLIRDTLELTPQYQGLEIKEVPEGYIIIEDEKRLVSIEEYEAEQAEKERQRILALSMTRSDFFDGFIMAFNLGQSELRTIVEQILNSINITDVEIKVALNNFDNALNFYRKHTLFTLLNAVEIPISEEITLVFTSDIWDKFFDTKDYKELQKAIKSKPISVDNDSDSDSDTDNIEEMENL